MTWLLWIYPPQWRRRYGEEFLALIGPQRLSFTTVVDIIGGAIDAWTQPQAHVEAQTGDTLDGGTRMFPRRRCTVAELIGLRGAGPGATVTPADSMKGAAVILGGTLLSALVGTWMHRRSVAPTYARALIYNGWLVAFLLSMWPTTLKEWPRRKRAVFVGFWSMVVISLALFTAWANS